jgi:hypothetical protein
MKNVLLLFLICISHYSIMAQKRGAVWCFGDSALVNFSDTSNITTGISAVKSRGSCASVSDTLGNLLFYVSYDPTAMIAGTDPVKAFNINNTILLNGDSMKGGGWYHEISIIPFPGSDSLFYIFNIGVTLDFGLYYSIVDMSANGGLGEVIQKNVQLQNFKMVDCLNAIKHGNGRDWWLIFRKSDFPSSSNNDFYFYLITPSGISNVIIQTVGNLNSTNSGRISFNTQGNQMSFINYKGLIELYDFDRCSGLLSNVVSINHESAAAPWPECWSAEFSPSGDALYVTSIAASAPDSSYLVQYDLLSPNISQSADTLWRTPFMINMGQLKLAPDNKIYLTTNYYGGYPYQDTVYNYINMNLSVINSPDSLGAACDLQPFSFSLGGQRSYFGLPNNPDYDLGPLVGSPCDTLVGVHESAAASATAAMFVYYAPNWQTAFINAQHITGSRYNLEVFDIMGKSIFRESGKLNPPYFTKNLNCGSFVTGIYTVVLQTEKERLVKRFVKE